MPVPQQTLFAIAVNSVSTEGQKLTPQKDGSMMISRMNEGIEMPVATLHPANGGKAVIIETALGTSAPIKSVAMVVHNLNAIGIRAAVTEMSAEAMVKEVKGSTKVEGPKELNVD